jgi:hypothetical protein
MIIFIVGQCFLRYYSYANFAAPFWTSSPSKLDFVHSSSSPLPASVSGLSFSVVFDSMFVMPHATGLHEISSFVSNSQAECVFFQIGSDVIASNLDLCSTPDFGRASNVSVFATYCS